MGGRLIEAAARWTVVGLVLVAWGCGTGICGTKGTPSEPPETTGTLAEGERIYLLEPGPFAVDIQADPHVPIEIEASVPAEGDVLECSRREGCGALPCNTWTCDSTGQDEVRVLMRTEEASVAYEIHVEQDGTEVPPKPLGLPDGAFGELRREGEAP